MPSKITKKNIIKLIKTTASEIEAINSANESLEKRRYELENSPELIAINKEQEELNDRAKNLTENAKELTKSLNEEYGWGNWHNLNIKTLEFLTREELEENEEFIKKHYIMSNPAIKERVHADDVEVMERRVMNDAELCQKVDELIKDQACI